MMVIMVMPIMAVNPVPIISGPGIVGTAVIRVTTIIPVRIVPWITVIAVGWITQCYAADADSH
jgi:hypothetical protein